ncbi:MAG: hypothetical protein ACI8QH_000928 [Flammeovirgaceae bacterium]|jgi:hypothetical protein
MMRKNSNIHGIGIFICGLALPLVDCFAVLFIGHTASKRRYSILSKLRFPGHAPVRES